MTRLPIESWDITPRFDIPPYSLNTVCPVTGEITGLEDHHIWRRSFTALGQDNRELYWIEYKDHSYSGQGVVVKNRVALSPEAHQRITANIARLEYRGTELYYIEKGEEKLLDLNLRLMAGGEKISRRRRQPKAASPEERKARKVFSIRTPEGEENVLPEWEEILRTSPGLLSDLSEQMDDPEKASSYWVWVAAAKRAAGL